MIDAVNQQKFAKTHIEIKSCIVNSDVQGNYSYDSLLYPQRKRKRNTTTTMTVDNALIPVLAPTKPQEQSWAQSAPLCVIKTIPVKGGVRTIVRKKDKASSTIDGIVSRTFCSSPAPNDAQKRTQVDWLSWKIVNLIKPTCNGRSKWEEERQQPAPPQHSPDDNRNEHVGSKKEQNPQRKSTVRTWSLERRRYVHNYLR